MHSKLIPTPIDNPEQSHEFTGMECGLTPQKSRQREELASNILQLTTGCPYGFDNPDFCPLHGVSMLEPAERAKWVEMLTDEELEYLSTYHEICLLWLFPEPWPCR